MNHYADPDERTAVIVGLRGLADYLDANPDVPAPRSAHVYVFPPEGSDAEMFAEIDAIADLMGTEASSADSPRGHYSAVRHFGPVEFRAIAIPESARDKDGTR